MSGKIVNLNRARKDRAREQGRRVADANATKYGRTKADKAEETARAAKLARDLEGHRRDD